MRNNMYVRVREWGVWIATQRGQMVLVLPVLRSSLNLILWILRVCASPPHLPTYLLTQTRDKIGTVLYVESKNWYSIQS